VLSLREKFAEAETALRQDMPAEEAEAVIADLRAMDGKSKMVASKKSEKKSSPAAEKNPSAGE
jgi:Flp pilus assembly protein TadD